MPVVSVCAAAGVSQRALATVWGSKSYTALTCCAAGHRRHVNIAGCSFLAAPTQQLGITGNSSSGAKAASPTKPAKGKGCSKGQKKQEGKAAAAGAAAASHKPAAADGKAAAKGKKGGNSAAAATAKKGTGAAAAVKQIGGQAGSAAAAFDA